MLIFLLLYILLAIPAPSARDPPALELEAGIANEKKGKGEKVNENPEIFAQVGGKTENLVNNKVVSDYPSTFANVSGFL